MSVSNLLFTYYDCRLFSANHCAPPHTHSSPTCVPEPEPAAGSHPAPTAGSHTLAAQGWCCGCARHCKGCASAERKERQRVMSVGVFVGEKWAAEAAVVHRVGSLTACTPEWQLQLVQQWQQVQAVCQVDKVAAGVEVRQPLALQQLQVVVVSWVWRCGSRRRSVMQQAGSRGKRFVLTWLRTHSPACWASCCPGKAAAFALLQALLLLQNDFVCWCC